MHILYHCVIEIIHFIEELKELLMKKMFENTGGLSLKTLPKYKKHGGFW